MNFVNKNPEYFLTIASEKSVSKAAEKLYVSQSYLSQHIAKLEQQFNIKLFNRSKNPIELTDAGKVYASYLESCNQLYQKLMSDFDDINVNRAQTLRIGLSNWRGSMILPDILPLFTQNHPGVRVELQERPVNEMYNLLSENKVDFVIMNTQPSTPDFVTTETIVYEKIVLAANTCHPLTSKLLQAQEEGKAPNLHLLENERFIMLGSEMILGKRVNNFLDKNQVVLRNRITTTNATTAIGLTAENMGFSFVNESIKRHVPHQNLVFFDLKSDDLLHPLNAVYKTDSYISPVARDFINLTREYYSKDAE